MLVRLVRLMLVMLNDAAHTSRIARLMNASSLQRPSSSSAMRAVLSGANQASALGGDPEILHDLCLI